MTLIKLLVLAVAGILSFVVAQHMLRGMQMAKARVRPSTPRHPRSVRRLRQDPRTGVYSPED